MFTPFGDRENVGGLESWNYLVICYGAASPVSLLNDGLKSRLT